MDRDQVVRLIEIAEKIIMKWFYKHEKNYYTSLDHRAVTTFYRNVPVKE